jgi:DNA-binding winged helix-turn-helix (wHTH) protein/tetratricopeptide (TPR) repeat protein
MADIKNNLSGFRFGIFEALPEAGLLTRRGQQVKIQDQPFRLLLALLEQPNQIVSREALVKRLWPGNTFVGFDQSLGTAITKLRQALGDDAENPRFIETVPRKGYRFIAPVSVVPSESSTAHTLNLPPASVGADSQRTGRLWRMIAISFVVAVLCVIGLALWRNQRTHLRLSANDAVILAEFENASGDAIFDSTLNGALRIKLEESPFLNVLPESTVHAALEHAGRSVHGRISLDDARATCTLLGAKAVIRGAITSASDGFSVRLTAISCSSGKVLAEEAASVSSPELVLASLGSSADALRRDLGEPEDSVQRFATPMLQATASSLSALKAFSIGEEKRSRGMDYETLSDYKLAADLDPEFALAYARLGVIYSNAQNNELAANNYRKAFDLRSHTTERERLYITSHYYSLVSGDLEKAVEVYNLWTQVYPHDLIAPNNLADLYEMLGQPEKSLEAAKAALRINPNHAFPYAVYLQAAQRLGRYKDAKDAWQRAAAKNLDTTVMLHMVLFRIGFAEADSALADSQMKWAAGNPREGEFLGLLGSAKIAAGRMQEAEADFHRSQAIAARNGLRDFASAVGLDLAQLEADVGYPERARAEVKHSLALAPNDPNTMAFAALILADTGDIDRSKMLARQVQNVAPESTVYAKILLPMIHSLGHLRSKQPDAAVQDLAAVAPYDLSRVTELASIYYRAQALHAARHYKDALAEYQRILDHRAICPVSPYIALAHLGIARTRNALGNRAGARTEYERFLDLWHNADRGIPIFIEARKELSTLPAASASAR